MIQWNDIGVKSFEAHLERLTLNKLYGGIHKGLIDPPMAKVYWWMCEQNCWFPPDQTSYVERMVKEYIKKTGESDSPSLRCRIGYKTYPAFIRQHHFGLALCEMLGKKCVIGGVMLDASYGVDWLVTHPNDEEAKLHAIHLSVNTVEANNHKRQEHKIHAYRNHDIRLDLNSGKLIGFGEQYILHPKSDFDNLLRDLATSTNQWCNSK